MGYRDDDDNEFEDEDATDEDETDEEETDEDSESEDTASEQDASDDEDDPDEEARLARIESAFRAERSVLRACVDVAELRAKRREYQAMLSNGGVVGVGRLRVNDLIEILDDRASDLKAKRFAFGRT